MNVAESPDKSFDKKQAVRIVDTTLRDGLQAPGIVFTDSVKIEIAERLAGAGIEEIEAGIPAMGAAAQTFIKDLVRRDLAADITAWCRAKKEDIEAAASCGVDGVHISMPASPVHMSALNWSYAQLFRCMDELLPFAHESFRFVSVGFQDVARISEPFLIKLVDQAYSYCVHRVRLADSVGLWMPDQVRTTLMTLNRLFPGICLGVHMHNDLGMGTANAYVAARAGALHIDATVLGIGERAGNTALEQIALALHLSNDFHLPIRMNELYSLCTLVASRLGRPIPVDQPVAGAHAFRHETGIHVHAQLQNRSAYEAYNPRLIGRCPELDVVIGAQSGSSAVRSVLENFGIRVSRQKASQMLPSIRRRAENLQRSLKAEEVVEIYRTTALDLQANAGEYSYSSRAECM